MIPVKRPAHPNARAIRAVLRSRVELGRGAEKTKRYAPEMNCGCRIKTKPYSSEPALDDAGHFQWVLCPKCKTALLGAAGRAPIGNRASASSRFWQRVYGPAMLTDAQLAQLTATRSEEPLPELPKMTAAELARHQQLHNRVAPVVAHIAPQSEARVVARESSRKKIARNLDRL